METGDVVMLCVDSISAREFIYECVKDKAELLIDGRMAAELCQVISAAGGLAMADYAKTLFPQSEAVPQRCTAKTTIYCANVLAGLMVAQYTKWMRSIPLESEFTFNLLTFETEKGEI